MLLFNEMFFQRFKGGKKFFFCLTGLCFNFTWPCSAKANRKAKNSRQKNLPAMNYNEHTFVSLKQKRTQFDETRKSPNRNRFSSFRKKPQNKSGV